MHIKKFSAAAGAALSVLCVHAFLAAALPGLARGAEGAVDFPPGAFSDGQHYQLSDFNGKLLVIFFYESGCPNCAAKMPGFDAIFQKYADKPVKFIGIGAHDSLMDVKGYAMANKLHVPVFADPLSIMSPAYDKMPISMANTIQFRTIGPDGSVGYLNWKLSTADIDAQVAGVKWKYKDDGYNPRLNGAIELLEWNQYEPGLRILRSFLKDSNKDVAESAQKLFDKVKAEGQGWKDQADKVADSDPVTAFDLYTKVSTVFAGDDLAKSVADPLKKLKASKPVTDELAARQLYSQLYGALTRVNPGDKNAISQVAGFCTNLSQKYPGTPTAARADAILKRLKAPPGR